MRIKANGIQTNYELSGRKGAPVVMFSHSLGSSLVMWDPQMEALEIEFQVLRYDIRGHGRTEGPTGPYTLELLGEDAIGLLDALRIEKVHWVGLSMGGMVGQSIALNYADRLLSLALCDTAALIPAEAQPTWEERIVVTTTKGIFSQMEPTMERWFTPSFLHLNPPMLEVIRKQFLTTSVEAYIGCIEAVRRLNYLERLSRIKLPTLIVVGEEDPGTPVAASRAMFERIPGSKLVVIPSARHLSNVEQPEAFNRALLGFLKGL
jgi:3-oxoadipate enol-lactonase